jgi:DNA invertase Pin-like site-specific DNA recombinase
VQEAKAHAYCEARGLSLVSAFVDVQSGRRNDRTEYRRMVESAKRGGADLIVVQFLDRFGRNPREILSRIWELKDFGIEVVATDEDIQRS